MPLKSSNPRIVYLTASAAEILNQSVPDQLQVEFRKFTPFLRIEKTSDYYLGSTSLYKKEEINGNF
ncbi:hypothetical protein NIES4073_45100 [Kalymmatonema gypsitolerans NIES-4073]|nr:hypothetical protein NIES4073_45100 [Scytonema sp. NIES-4073]